MKILLINRLHGSSHFPFIASNHLLDEYNRLRFFLHTRCCYDVSVESEMFSINIEDQMHRKCVLIVNIVQYRLFV